MVVLVGVLAAKYVACRSGNEPDCLHAIRDSNDDLAVIVCEREYAEGHDPTIGAKLANSLRRSGNLARATTIATGLLATDARADAQQILGKIAITQHRLDDGKSALDSARGLHLAAHQPDQVAIDDQALAGIYTRRKQFAEALRALDACIAESHEAHDAIVEGYCHMSAGGVLSDIGYFEGAQQEFELAQPLLDMDRDLAALALERAGLEQAYSFGPARQNYHHAAVAELESAITHARRAQLTRVELSAELNITFSLAELGRTDEAARHLEAARKLDVDNADTDDRALLEARIAYRRGDFALATARNTATYDRVTDPDDKLRVCVMQARIALRASDFEGAATWAKRGVEVAEGIRAEQSAIELRPWVLSSRREPYELLFTALAHLQRYDEALVAFDQWQGRTLLDALARDRTRPPDLRTAAVHSETLHRAFATLSSAPVMRTIDPAALTSRLRSADALALVIAEDELWRVVSRHGNLAMADLGPLPRWQPQLAGFVASPTSAELATSLGTALLGPDVFRDTDEPLIVVLDSRVAAIPVAALQGAGKPLIAMRPVIHAPRLSEVGCVPAPAKPHHVLVLGDAHGDLPSAKREAEEVAAALGVTPLVGSDATSDSLFKAAPGDIVHVAVHANVDLGGGSLALSDRPVSALEISVRAAGAALVMLTACASAAADDGEQATSLATAFLASGSTAVIATLRPVSDAGARELATAFYRAGGADDPARALASIQAASARTNNPDWPSFVMFGHDVCRKEKP